MRYGLVKTWNRSAGIRIADRSYSRACRNKKQNHAECFYCRVRTWLQLMCCALALKLGVLISEWSEKGCDRAECDGAEM